VHCQIALKTDKMVLYRPRRPRKCENQLPVKSKIADGPNNVNLYIAITSQEIFQNFRFRSNLVCVCAIGPGGRQKIEIYLP